MNDEIQVGCDYVQKANNRVRVYVKSVSFDGSKAVVRFSYYRDDNPDMLTPNVWEDSPEGFLADFRFYQEG